MAITTEDGKRACLVFWQDWMPVAIIPAGVATQAQEQMLLHGFPELLWLDLYIPPASGFNGNWASPAGKWRCDLF